MALANLSIGERLGASAAARASDPRRCQLAADAGALSVVVDALTRHAGHDGVLHWGTTAVLRLTHDSAERTQLALSAGAKTALAAAAALPTTKDLPAVASKIELARRWLEMHESGSDGGGGLPEKLSKAARVLKDLVFEQSVTDNVELPPEATGMARVAA